MPEGMPGSRLAAGGLLTLPNAVTFGRLCAVPLAVWLILQQQTHLAFGLFVAAGLSDVLDGWLARRCGSSAMGAMLDPVADKALLVTMYVTLASAGALPEFLAILVVFRDLLIVGGVLLLTGFHLHAPMLLDVLVWAVAASTLCSGGAYIWKAARAR